MSLVSVATIKQSYKMKKKKIGLFEKNEKKKIKAQMIKRPYYASCITVICSGQNDQI